MQCINGHYVSGDYCFLCDELIRPPKEKVKGVPKMSQNRAKDSKVYAKKRREFLTLNPVCKVKAIGCSRKAEDIHHRAGRGNNYLNEKTFLAVCRNCHDKITEDSKWAVENGYSILRNVEHKEDE
jgi:hypothetical protein